MSTNNYERYAEQNLFEARMQERADTERFVVPSDEEVRQSLAVRKATMPPANEIPPPGIYENVPFETYLSWPVLSNSKLQAAFRSLMHFKEQEPISETDAMRFGTLCHTGRLEQSAVYRRYVVMPDLTSGIVLADGTPAKNPKATKEYAKRVEDWTAAQAGKAIVTQDDFDLMVSVITALDRDNTARAWFSCEGQAEVSIVWDDQETGLRLKGRIDKVAHRLQILADLKTCRDCKRFATVIAERGYHRQAALYLDGWEVLTGEVYRFGIAAVENTKPCGVMAAPLHDDAVEVGRDQYRAALRDIAKAHRTGHWSGYESPSAWKLPAWYDGGEQSVNLVIAGSKVSL